MFWEVVERKRFLDPIPLTGGSAYCHFGIGDGECDASNQSSSSK